MISQNQNQRYGLEVSDVIASCYNELYTRYNISYEQDKVLDALLRCRTSKAGGHILKCNHCNYQQQCYNSCRNRHCPKCQYLKQQQWVDQLQSRLVPGRYFHIVFTIPDTLHPLFYINQKQCYDILFQSASEALQNAGRNPDFLGADVGALCILHTWGQALTYHPHIHMLVPAGGLSSDGAEWIASRRKFFVPIKALSAMFRGILIKKLKSLLDNEELNLPSNYEGFKIIKEKLYEKSWNVYSKKAFGGINSVLKYLGRYTHRVAISNNRLLALKDKTVSFNYKDYRTGTRKVMLLSTVEFVRRFIQHVLPKGFFKIRYIGIFSIVHIHGKREQVISLVGKVMYLSQLEGLCAYEILREITGKDPSRCPICKQGIMVQIKRVRQLE
ncbi:IS91 family transposase [Plebeiibacterium sediminum]|uniref:IS91 family transposase n=1 Tax=Plebeiibacterium sediminum TaxID=2992112 RepID=A0AAE3M9B0_9BACT|nr:IS91 family transposase [Plebeiobacterium sediminum]MCW3789614.1 IS91 family transposase [Plebeiobacterium sediminum]